MSKIQDVNSLKDSLKETSVTLDGKKEEISKTSVNRALAIIDCEIKTVQDAFLYFASLNLLNSYVKDHKNEISYRFKGKVIPAIDQIIKNGIENISFGYEDSASCTLVNINGLQFTFHGTKLSDLQTSAREENDANHGYYTTEEWEGLRLQPLARSVFEFAEKLDGLTIDVESLLSDENEME